MDGNAPAPRRPAAWLQLLRVPNLFTVPGDPLAGGKVARIDAAGVWLHVPGAAGLRLLKWLPDVVKTPLRASAREPLNSPHAPARKEKK